MIRTREELSARELFDRVCGSLKEEVGERELALPSNPMPLVGLKSDRGKTDIKYARYGLRVVVLKLETGRWVIASGTAPRGAPYDCDIMAVQLSGNGSTNERIAAVGVYEAIEKNSYFRNSLICALPNGELMVHKTSRFYGEVHTFLKSSLRGFAVAAQTDVRYREGFIEILSEELRQILAVGHLLR